MAVSTETVQKIWDILMAEYQNPYGVAGLMGNLMAESSLNPCCITGGGIKTADQKAEYISKIKSSGCTAESFGKDGIAFGLAQWYYWSRKASLFNYAKNNGIPIDSAETQARFLIREMASYKAADTAIRTLKNIRAVSDIVMDKYEKPANKTEPARQKRATYGQEIYDKYFKEDKSMTNTTIKAPTPVINNTPITKKDAIEKTENPKKQVMVLADNVNLRVGNGKQYDVGGRVETIGTKLDLVATAENGWNAVIFRDRVLWVSPDFSKIVT